MALVGLARAFWPRHAPAAADVNKCGIERCSAALCNTPCLIPFAQYTQALLYLFRALLLAATGMLIWETVEKFTVASEASRLFVFLQKATASSSSAL